MNIEDITKHKIFLKYLHKQTEATCISILKEDGLMLKDVRKPTLHMKKVAVKQNGLALEFVREQDKDLELCIIAVMQNIKAKKFVPESLIKDVEWYIAYYDYPYILQMVIRGFHNFTSIFR